MRAALLIAWVCIATAWLTAEQANPPQAKAPQAKAPAAPAVSAAQSRPPALNTPEDVVREWFRRWNALDGSESSIRRLIDLYQPAGVNQVPPSATQIGSVYMEGPEGVRKLAEDFLKAFTQPNDTVGSLFFKTLGPWGGPAIGVQYTQVATDRATKKRYVLPAFAIFHIEGGKIRYARFYATAEETRAE